MSDAPEPDRPLLERFKDSRFVRVLLIYLGVSWPVLGVVGTLQDVLLLPDWVSPATLVALLAGLVVVLATAWIQSSPLLERVARVVPDVWAASGKDALGDLRRGHMPDMTWGRSLAVLLFAAWLAFGFAGAYVLISGRGHAALPLSAAAEDVPAGVAIMPFSTSGVDPDVYGEGLVPLLSTTLDGVAGLRAIDSRTVLARWEEAASEPAPDLATILDVGLDAGARYVLVGDALRAGAKLNLTGQLYDARTGTNLGSVRVQGALDSVIAVVDHLSVEAARLLIAHAGGDLGSIQHLESLTTRSPVALDAYLDGERHYRVGEFNAALEEYDRAIQADSTFALAHLRAAIIYGWEGGLGVAQRREAHLSRAAQHAGRLPARERALLDAARVLAGLEAHTTADLREALRDAERAAHRYPDDPDLWEVLGELYYHRGPRALEPRAEGIEALRRAIELQPDVAPYHIHVAEHAISYGDSADAAYWVARERELASDEVFTRAHHRAFTLVHGTSPARDAVLDTLRSTDRRTPGYLINALEGPRRLEIRLSLLQATAPAPPAAGYRQLIFTRINRGRLPDDPLAQVTTGLLGLTGTPDLEVVDRLGFAPLSALAAAVGGRTPAFQARRARLEDLERSTRERDAEAADGLAMLGRLATAVATLKHGQPADALPLLQDLVAEIEPEHMAGSTLFQLGAAHEALGHRREALRHFRAATDYQGGHLSMAILRAARLHQRLGEHEAAEALYRDLLIAWQDADPFFDPWVDEARRALTDP